MIITENACLVLWWLVGLVGDDRGVGWFCDSCRWHLRACSKFGGVAGVHCFSGNSAEFLFIQSLCLLPNMPLLGLNPLLKEWVMPLLIHRYLVSRRLQQLKRVLLLLLRNHLLRVCWVLDLRLVIEPAPSLHIGLRLNTSLLNHSRWASTCRLWNSTVVLSYYLHRMRLVDRRELNALLGLNLPYFSTLSLNFWRPRIGNTGTLNVHLCILESSIVDRCWDPFANHFGGPFLHSSFISIFNFLGQ